MLPSPPPPPPHPHSLMTFVFAGGSSDCRHTFPLPEAGERDSHQVVGRLLGSLGFPQPRCSTVSLETLGAISPLLLPAAPISTCHRAAAATRRAYFKAAAPRLCASAERADDFRLWCPYSRWFEAGLDELRSLGVDGFKLDGGDPEYYAQVQHGACGSIYCPSLVAMAASSFRPWRSHRTGHYYRTSVGITITKTIIIAPVWALPLPRPLLSHQCGHPRTSLRPPVGWRGCCSCCNQQFQLRLPIAVCSLQYAFMPSPDSGTVIFAAAGISPRSRARAWRNPSSTPSRLQR